MRFRSYALLMICWSALLLNACASLFSQPSPATPSVTSLVLTHGVNADYSPVQPTSGFSPAEPFHVSVRVANLPVGARLKARWFYGTDLISETPFHAEQGGSGWIAFQLSRSAPWPVGHYRVDVLADERVLGSASFEVRLAP